MIIQYVVKNAKVIVWVWERVGIATVVMIVFGWLAFNKLEKMQQSMKRISRNQVAMMKKMGVPIPYPQPEAPAQ